jgi:hypothetical protein
MSSTPFELAYAVAYAVYPHDLILPSSPEYESQPDPDDAPYTPEHDIDMDYSPTSPRYVPTEEELQQMLGPTWTLVPTLSEQYGTFLPDKQGTKRKAEDEHPDQPPAKRQQ